MTTDKFQTSGSNPTRPAKDRKPTLDTPLPLDTSLPTVPRSSSSTTGSNDGLLSDGVVIKGRYRVVRHIASGGMGDVYEVFDEVSREPRAVKVMKSQLLSSPEARERFLKESKAQDLRHPSIVKTIDVDEWPEQNVLFIAMELAPGKTLRQWQTDQKAGDEPAFSVADVLEICRQVCAGLTFAHRLTIHRDIKPENILLEKTDDDCWHARIADFGITKLLEVGEFTATSQSFGTFQYMAPEQQRDAGSVDHRADIYSVGVVLYELLTGQLPVGHFPLPSETNGSIPREIDSLIKRALAASPDSRYSDMAMMLADVERVLGMVTDSAKPRPREAVPVDLSNVNLGQIVIELRERRLAQVEVPGLPPIPEEILRLRAQIEDLDQAIADLKQAIHPALRPHQEVLRQINEQHAAALQDLEDDPLSRDKGLISRLGQLIDNAGAVNTQQLQDAGRGEHGVSELLATVTRLRNAKLALDAQTKAQEQYENARVVEQHRLESQRKESREKLTVASVNDLSSLLKPLRLRDQAATEEPFPLEGFGRLARLLQQQKRYEWDEWETLNQAESIWQKSAEQQAWSKVVAANTQGACEEFLTAYPESMFSSEVRLMLLRFRVNAILLSTEQSPTEADLAALAEYLRLAECRESVHRKPFEKRYRVILDKLVTKLHGNGPLLLRRPAGMTSGIGQAWTFTTCSFGFFIIMSLWFLVTGGLMYGLTWLSEVDSRRGVTSADAMGLFGGIVFGGMFGLATFKSSIGDSNEFKRRKMRERLKSEYPVE